MKINNPYLENITMTIKHKEKLIAKINNAFSNVLREDGVTLHEAMAIDDRLGDREIYLSRQKDTDKNWQDVDLTTLENFDSALSSLDVKGFRYYIPCYMIASILEYIDYQAPCFHLIYFHPDSLRKSKPERFIEKYNFSIQQAEAIANYMQYLLDLDLYSFNAIEVEKMKEWKKYCERF